jgi:flagellar biosynthesis protein FlhF
MNVKRYIAEDVTGAMGKVRAELGLDAFILNTRKIRHHGMSGFFRPPLVEVVAAYEPAASQVNHPAPAAAREPEIEIHTPPPRAAPAPPPEDRVTPLLTADTPIEGRVLTTGFTSPEREAFGVLENKLDSLSCTLSALMGKMQAKGDFRQRYAPEVEELVFALIGNEVHEDFAHKLGREVTDVLGRPDAEDPGEVMEDILRQTMGDPAPIKLKRYKRTVVIMVGPTGVGKTTTIAKLAAIYSLNHHAHVGIITTDTYRIAAVEQLRTYAEIIEVPISVVYSPDEMEDALKQFEQCDLVFIDTAGKSPNDPTMEAELTSLLKASKVDEIHLVLSATTGFSSCLGIIKMYSFLGDFKLLFTKMDETPTWGMLLNLTCLTKSPISYLAAGQTVPDDIEVMDAHLVANHLLNKGKSL